MSSSISKKTRKTLTGIAYISPWIIGFSCFGIIPLVYSFYCSFCQYRLGGQPKFLGGTDKGLFYNYVTLFSGTYGDFYVSFKNTFVFTFLTTTLTMIIGLTFSLIINSVPKLKRFFQTVYYLPGVLPLIAATMLWEAMFAQQGILNGIFGLFGREPIIFMNHKNAMASLILMSVWGGIGGKITMLCPTIASVSTEMLESMELDGANTFDKIIHAIIPMISPTIFYLLIMDIIGGLQVYAPMMMLGGGTATVSATLQIYNLTFTDRAVGFACAYAWVLFVLILIITILFFRFGGKKVYYADGD